MRKPRPNKASVKGAGEKTASGTVRRNPSGSGKTAPDGNARPDPGRRTPPPGMVLVGVILGARGVRGEVRLRSFTEDPKGIGAYGPLGTENGRRLKVKVLGPVKGGFAARIEGVGDRDAAQALAGTALYVARADLPPPEEDAFYHADLIGLEVRGPEGAVIGTVKAVHDFGAGDLLEIRRAPAMSGAGPDGEPRKTVLLPFTREAVPEIHIAEGWLAADPPPGLLSDEPPEDEA